MLPVAPAGFVRALRRAVDEPTLEVEFDLEVAERTNRPAWLVLYREPTGQQTLVTDWSAGLDGNLGAIVAEVKKVDARAWSSKKAWVNRVCESVDTTRARKLAKRRDEFRQRAKYMRRAVQKFRDAGGK